MKTENTFQQQMDVIDQLTEHVDKIIQGNNQTANVFDSYSLRNRPEYVSGTILWGFAYQFHSTKEGMRLSQKPVKGMLLKYKDKKHYEEFIEHPNDYSFQGAPSYFIPFSQKTPNRLLFSQAVSIYGRKYALAEQDAWDGYYDEIMKALKTGNGHIKEILDDLHRVEKLE